MATSDGFVQSTAVGSQNTNVGPLATGIGSLSTPKPVVPASTNANTNAGIKSTGTEAGDLAAGLISSAPLAGQSTTTLSSNKTADISGIQGKTANLSGNNGVKTDTTSGVTTTANGQAYVPTPTVTGAVQNPDGSTSTTYSDGTTKQTVAANGTTPTGGYYGDTYVAPGSPIPKDANGVPVSLTDVPPSVQSNLDSYQKLLTQSDALTASLIANTKASYEALIKQQQQANTSSQGSLNTFLLKNGSLQGTQSGQGALQYQITYGLTQISDLQTKENAAIIAAQQAGESQDFQLQSKINDTIESLRQEKQAAITKQNDNILAAQKTLADQQFQMQKTTTDTINQISEDAAKNGASPSVIQAIGASKDINSAINAAGDSLQTLTGDLADYPQYKKDALANGLTPLDATDWLAKKTATDIKNKESEAYGTAYASAEGKNAADLASGVLSSQDSTAISQAQTRLAGDKVVQGFQNIADNYKVVNTIPDGTTDPTQQSVLLTAIAHILSPNASSLRGALNAIDKNSLQSGVYNKLNDAAQAFQTKGDLSPDAVNSLKAEAQNIYNENLDSYKTIRNDAVSTLQNRNIKNADSYIDNYGDLGTVDPKTQVNNYVTSNPKQAETIAKLYEVPGATDQDVLDYINQLPK